MIKVTLEFTSVDQAIVALGKLAGAQAVAKTPLAVTTEPVPAATPAAPAPATSTRKGRSDKGKPRKGGEQPAVALTNGGDAQPLTSEQVKAIAAAKANAEDDAVRQKMQDACDAAAPAATAVPTLDEAKDVLQAAFDKRPDMKVWQDVLSRFGVRRVADVPEDRRAEFMEKAKSVADGGAI